MPSTAQTATPPQAPPAGCASAATWFHVEDLGDGVTLISEPGHVNCFLVQGTDRALLFDSGLGIAPISEIVASLTDTPLLVVSSHDHVDHRGGNADLVAHAEELRLVAIAAHPSAVDPASATHRAADPGFLLDYAAAMTGVYEDYLRFEALDEQSFFVLAGLGRMRPMPDTSTWHVPGVRPTLALHDGARIDLGDRTLRVVHTPGHSPDSLVLVDERSGTLLAGDTVIAAASWLHNDGSDLAAFAASTAHLAGLPLTRVLTAHNLIAVQPPERVAAVARAAALTRDGGTRPVAGWDLLGYPVDRHTHAGVTLLLPASPSSRTADDAAAVSDLAVTGAPTAHRRADLAKELA
ncbi:Glyoxylase, beta-lactamase superfamily II [Sanguibacter gelidistatuariae]|uniref:Glyoxylase, beta-lactamase superfamily II n=1 Tax=Sanguibacter gelidistatuariae TaxID=1814289 RepID=A0A1G6GTT6_9MICO|nr:MBL fold metallo-hydrolase [Sanguibacter gelidistatuariae]SDB84546.1 Glyoxylase, beta-lactamase superfamily II [Sanguibacter gelidistatuariae]